MYVNSCMTYIFFTIDTLLNVFLCFMLSNMYGCLHRQRFAHTNRTIEIDLYVKGTPLPPGPGTKMTNFRKIYMYLFTIVFGMVPLKVAYQMAIR